MTNDHTEMDVFMTSYPLHVICGLDFSQKNYLIALDLLARGANPNVSNCEGITPLHMCATYGNYELLQLLLQNGADVDCQTDDDLTAFQLAFEEGNEECCRLLSGWKISSEEPQSEPLDSPKTPIQNRPNSTPRAKLFSPIVYTGGAGYHHDRSPNPSPAVAKEPRSGGYVPRLFNSPLKLPASSPDLESVQLVKRPKSHISLDQISDDVSVVSNDVMVENSPGSRRRDCYAEFTACDATDSTLKQGSIFGKSHDSPDAVLQSLRKPEPRRTAGGITGSKSAVDVSRPVRQKLFFSSPVNSPGSRSEKLKGMLCINTDCLKSGSRDMPTLDKQNVSPPYEVTPDPKVPSSSSAMPRNTRLYPDLTGAEDGPTPMRPTPRSSLLDRRASGRDIMINGVSDLFDVSLTLVDDSEPGGVASYRSSIAKHPNLTLAHLKDPLFSTESQSEDSFSSIATDVEEEQKNIPKELLEKVKKYSNEKLKSELSNRGVDVGPLLPNTRWLYEYRLALIVQEEFKSGQIVGVFAKAYPVELKQFMLNDRIIDHPKMIIDEQSLIDAFKCRDKTWREGNKKMSFCYLLLDPRVWNGKPTATLSFTLFIDSIFYVGKGKNSRASDHLLRAKLLAEGKLLKVSEDEKLKLNRIIEIWNSNSGVGSFQFSPNVIPVEAYTREALIIDTIGKNNLTNAISGQYYGPSASWSVPKRRLLGVFLLDKNFSLIKLSGCPLLMKNDV